MDTRGEVTRLLEALRQGDPSAGERLAPLVYGELRRLSRSFLRRERPDHSLQPTALVHEAYLRLMDQRSITWQNRAHFFGVAAQLMRMILVDHARRHRAVKHGGGRVKVTLEKIQLFNEEQYDELLALDEALAELAKVDARAVRVVELRFFAELTNEETAEVLGVSPKTVKRDWQLARPWLHRFLTARAGTP